MKRICAVFLDLQIILNFSDCSLILWNQGSSVNILTRLWAW